MPLTTNTQTIDRNPMEKDIETRMFINGHWQAAASRQTRPILNPASGEIIAEVAEGDRVDSIAAIAAARKAFENPAWRNLSGVARGEILHEIAAKIRQHKDRLAYLESLDTGKTLTESEWDMDDIAGIFAYYAGLADKDAGETIDSPIPDSTSQLVREPIGVCGQISPWNYPLLQASWKLAPALAAGCTIVMKPSEITPLSSIYICSLFESIGLPPGVVNLVLGPGPSVGAELAESTNVDLISFTGGIATGRRIMQAASSNIKKVALELGGKNPHIIFDDADFDHAVEQILNGVFFHAGQICSAGARLLVQDSLYNRLRDALAERISKIKIGPGLTKGTQMGPLISEDHLKKVEDYVRIASAEGARLLCGGKRPQGQALQQGFYFEPTLFVDCEASMRIVQEEVFGPIITMERFQSESEVLELANATDYGLSAGFWTQDMQRAHRMSHALRFGTVWINEFNVYFCQAPWGGYKTSGLGRELGKAGLEEYTEIKHIFQNHKPEPLRWFGV